MSTRKKIYLFIIVIAQFCCTSLWFASNGVLDDLIVSFNLSANVVGSLSSAVQLGFIVGTILFALVSLVDRFSPSKIFLICASLGSVLNLGILWDGNNLASLLVIRFFTGFFLAGIYPVGMKIASDHFEKGLGKSLGFLVGALVVGTAFPHALKAYSGGLSWQVVISVTSTMALIGGILMIAIVPDGPFRRAGTRINLLAIPEVFRNRPFRLSAFGYFGHMWELYTFWVFVPIILQSYALVNKIDLNIAFWSFSIIALGGLACILAGLLSEVIGSTRVAIFALIGSGLCCLLCPFIFNLDQPIVFLVFLIFWGMVAVADSPVLSTLVANYSIAELRGTSLTIVTGIGFAITIASILLVNFLSDIIEIQFLMLVLAIGPILGLISLWKIKSSKITTSVEEDISAQ